MRVDIMEKFRTLPLGEKVRVINDLRMMLDEMVSEFQPDVLTSVPSNRKAPRWRADEDAWN